MAKTDYSQDLINHYEIGKEIGFLDGAMMAYKDIRTAIDLEDGMTITELAELINLSIDKYEELLEKLSD